MADNYLTNKPCEHCGQRRRRKSRRFCSHVCYQANRTPGDPVKRFWKHVNKTPDCWLWRRSTNAKGYGQFILPDGPILAHRYAWQLTNGPVPDGLSVLHRCDNPPCVRPDHLFLGTLADNNHDMMEKGRDRKRGLKGSNNTSAKLTDDAVRIIRAERAAGQPLKVLAQRFGVCEAIISSVALRRTWKHVE